MGRARRNMFLIGKLSAGLGNYPSLKSHNHMAPGVQNGFVLFEVDQKGPMNFLTLGCSAVQACGHQGTLLLVSEAAESSLVLLHTNIPITPQAD